MGEPRKIPTPEEVLGERKIPTPEEVLGVKKKDNFLNGESSDLKRREQMTGQSIKPTESLPNLESQSISSKAPYLSELESITYNGKEVSAKDLTEDYRASTSDNRTLRISHQSKTGLQGDDLEKAYNQLYTEQLEVTKAKPLVSDQETGQWNEDAFKNLESDFEAIEKYNKDNELWKANSGYVQDGKWISTPILAGPKPKAPELNSGLTDHKEIETEYLTQQELRDRVQLQSFVDTHITDDKEKNKIINAYNQIKQNEDYGTEWSNRIFMNTEATARDHYVDLSRKIFAESMDKSQKKVEDYMGERWNYNVALLESARGNLNVSNQELAKIEQTTSARMGEIQELNKDLQDLSYRTYIIGTDYYGTQSATEAFFAGASETVTNLPAQAGAATKAIGAMLPYSIGGIPIAQAKAAADYYTESTYQFLKSVSDDVRKPVDPEHETARESGGLMALLAVSAGFNAIAPAANMLYFGTLEQENMYRNLKEQNQQIGLGLTDNEMIGAATLYGTLTLPLFFGLGGANPLTKGAKAKVMKNFMADLKVNKSVFQNATRRGEFTSITQRIPYWFRDVTEGGLHMAGAMGGVDLLNKGITQSINIIKGMPDDKKLQVLEPGKTLLESTVDHFIHNFTIGGILRGASSLASPGNRPKSYADIAWYLNDPTFVRKTKSYIESRYKDPRVPMSKGEYEGILRQLDYDVTAVKSTPKDYTLKNQMEYSTLLSDKQRIEYDSKEKGYTSNADLAELERIKERLITIDAKEAETFAKEIEKAKKAEPEVKKEEPKKEEPVKEEIKKEPVKEKTEEQIQADLAKETAKIEEQEKEGTIEDNVGKTLRKGNETGEVKVDEGGKVTFETDKRVYELGLKKDIGKDLISDHSLKIEKEPTKKAPEAKPKREFEVKFKEDRGINKKGEREITIFNEKGQVEVVTGQRATDMLNDAKLRTGKRKAQGEYDIREKERVAAKNLKEKQEAPLKEAVELESRLKKATDDIEKEILTDIVNESSKESKDGIVFDNKKRVKINTKGEYVVSAFNKDKNKWVGVGHGKTREKLISQFIKEKAKREKERLSIADQLIKAEREQNKDKVETFLEDLIKQTKLDKGELNDVTRVIGAKLAQASLKVVLAAYKAGKELSAAIKEGYELIKDKGISRHEYRKWIIGEITKPPPKDAKKTKEVRKEGEQKQTKKSGVGNLPKSDRPKTAQKKDIIKQAKSKKSLKSVMKSIFGLKPQKAEAAANIMDALVRRIASKEGILPSEVYKRMKFVKASDQTIKDIMDGSIGEGVLMQMFYPEVSNMSKAEMRGLDIAIEREKFYEGDLSKSEIAEEVRYETGWERDINGDWFYEGTYNGKFKKEWNKIKEDKLYALTDVWSHPELYKRIPNAKNIIFIKDSSLPKKTGGDYNPNTKTIRINPKVKVEAALETMFHEIQHDVIDRKGDKQGFDGDRVMKNLFRKADKLIDDKYIDLVAETATKEYKDAFLDFLDKAADVKELHNRIQSKIESKETVKSEVMDDYRALQKEISENQAAKDLVYEIYRNSFHEIMAHQAGERSTFTPEQRRDITVDFGVDKDMAKKISENYKFQNGKEFAQGAQLTKDGEHIIYALTSPNVSTPVHEMSHVYEHYLSNAERKTILDWTGDKSWTKDTSESFARGFEKYLKDGESPNAEMRTAFERFKKWLTEIYEGTKDLDIELNDSMKDLYDNMISGESFEQKVKNSVDLSKQVTARVDKLRPVIMESDAKAQQFQKSILWKNRKKVANAMKTDPSFQNFESMEKLLELDPSKLPEKSLDAYNMILKEYLDVGTMTNSTFLRSELSNQTAKADASQIRESGIKIKPRGGALWLTKNFFGNILQTFQVSLSNLSTPMKNRIMINSGISSMLTNLSKLKLLQYADRDMQEEVAKTIRNIYFKGAGIKGYAKAQRAKYVTSIPFKKARARLNSAAHFMGMALNPHNTDVPLRKWFGKADYEMSKSIVVLGEKLQRIAGTDKKAQEKIDDIKRRVESKEIDHNQEREEMLTVLERMDKQNKDNELFQEYFETYKAQKEFLDFFRDVQDQYAEHLEGLSEEQIQRADNVMNLNPNHFVLKKFREKYKDSYQIFTTVSELHKQYSGIIQNYMQKRGDPIDFNPYYISLIRGKLSAEKKFGPDDLRSSQLLEKGTHDDFIAKYGSFSTEIKEPGTPKDVDLYFDSPRFLDTQFQALNGALKESFIAEDVIAFNSYFTNNDFIKLRGFGESKAATFRKAVAEGVNFHLVRDDFGIKFSSATRGGRITNDIVRTMMELPYRVLLGVAQPIKQYTQATFPALSTLSSLSSFKALAENVTSQKNADAQNFLFANYSNASSREGYKLIDSGFGSNNLLGTKGWSEFAIGQPDYKTGFGTWISAYRHYRVKEGDIKSFDWAKEASNPNKEAAAHANTEVFMGQGSSLREFTANFIKNPNIIYQAIRTLAMPYSTFVGQLKNSIMVDIGQMKDPYARSRMAGYMGVIAGYHSVAWALGNTLNNTIYNAMTSLFPDDDTSKYMRYVRDKSKQSYASRLAYGMKDLLPIPPAPIVENFVLSGANEAWFQARNMMLKKPFKNQAEYSQFGGLEFPVYPLGDFYYLMPETEYIGNTLAINKIIKDGYMEFEDERSGKIAYTKLTEEDIKNLKILKWMNISAGFLVEQSIRTEARRITRDYKKLKDPNWVLRRVKKGDFVNQLDEQMMRDAIDEMSAGGQIYNIQVYKKLKSLDKIFKDDNRMRARLYRSIQLDIKQAIGGKGLDRSDVIKIEKLQQQLIRIRESINEMPEATIETKVHRSRNEEVKTKKDYESLFDKNPFNLNPKEEELKD